MKKKIILSSIMILAAIAVICAVFGINNYIDTHTWATISIDGVSESETSDAFDQQQECLKGDHISIGSVILEVTDITHDGTVTFVVVQGDLQDESGNSIDEDTLTLRAKKRYRIPNGNIGLEVVSNRYQ